MSLAKKSLNDAKLYVQKVLEAGLTPYVTGSPGVGKSALMKDIAKTYGLKFIDIRLSQEDPTSLNGFPKIDNGRSEYLPPKTFPINTDQVPEGYNGWLIFFDELPSAPRSTLAAAYKIILDKLVGEHPLHERCLIAAAGNFMEDNAIVNEIGTALRSRMVHIHVESSAPEYINYCTKSKFDSRIIAYLEYKKDRVNTFQIFNTGIDDETFCCERTWDFVNRLLRKIEPNQVKPIPVEYADLLCGTIGSTALEFVAFTQAFKDLPDYNEILKHPCDANIPYEISNRYLLMGMLSNNTTYDDLEKVMEYIERYNKEFQFIFVKMLWAKDVKFIQHPSIDKICLEISDLLMS